MIPIEKLQSAAAAYLDAELLPKLPGVQKWIFGGTAALWLERLPDMIRNVPEGNLFRKLGILSDTNEVDADTAYRLIKKQAQTGSASVNIPLIGVITLTEADVDRLYQYIIS